jgi:hypothetical protein
MLVFRHSNFISILTSWQSWGWIGVLRVRNTINFVFATLIVTHTHTHRQSTLDKYMIDTLFTITICTYMHVFTEFYMGNTKCLVKNPIEMHVMAKKSLNM